MISNQRSLSNLLIASVTMLLVAPVQALESLDDQEMGAVTGREGVAISLEYYYNSERTDDPATTGQGLASCTDGGLADMDCRLAWQLANRGVASTNPQGVGTWAVGGNTFKGEWLVWKGGWMSLAVNSLNLDASFLRDAISAGASYEGLLDANLVGVYGSFVDSSGTCLMPIDPSGSYGACSVDYIKNMPALRAHYSHLGDTMKGGTYSDGSKISTGFDDVRFGMEVTGLSAEYDCATTTEAGCTTSAQIGPGWMLNNGDSFTSLKIADNNANQAGITFGGNFYLYGF